MKVKVYVVDFEIPMRVRKWGIRVGASAIMLTVAAVAIAAPPLHTWSTGEALQAVDLNGNFSNLQSQITASQHPASAFHATLTNADTIASGVITVVAFNHVDFDLGSEYTPGTGTFIPKNAGVYLLNCGIAFVTTANGTSQWSANIYKNGNTEVVGTDFLAYAAGVGVRPEVTTIMQLSANDSVVCRAYQSSGSSQSINESSSFIDRNTFSAARLY